ncbi:MAG TPA: hypothetical protein VMT79_20755 [Candidatus Binatia bacterium]|nr:hypothetical protein [Candidatus Binatia bacterium]
MRAILPRSQSFRGGNLLRGVVLFPYMIPTIVAVMLWKWRLNDSYGLVNHLLVALGLVRTPVAWLGKDYIMWSQHVVPTCGPNATIVDWGLIMAAGVVITVPTIAFFVAVRRYLVQGWGAGGVKG